MADSAKVAIVLDDDRDLEGIVSDRLVWASRTPRSEALAEHIRDEGARWDRLTTFNFDASGDIEAQVLDLIYEIDLHHGASGGRPPLGRLDVYGAALTASMTETLHKLGLGDVQATPVGFSADAPHASANDGTSFTSN